MSSKTMKKIDYNKLEALITKTLNSNNTSVKNGLIETMQIIIDAGIEIEDRFLSGAMKGLLTLTGEQYVEINEFQNILAKYVFENLVPKASYVINNSCEEFMKELAEKNVLDK